LNTCATPVQQTKNQEPRTKNQEDKEKTPRADRAVIPPELNDIHGFKDEWEKWVAHRKRIRKPASEDTKRRVLKVLAERPAESIKAMQIGIDSGWTDIKWEWIDKRVQSSPEDRPKYDWEIAMEQEAAERARQEAIEAEIAAKSADAKKQATQDGNRIDAPKRVLPPPFPKIPAIFPHPQPAPSNEQPKLSLADRKRMLEQDLNGRE
jgi:hypothetical protein